MSALRLTLLAAATLLVGALLAGCAGGDCTSSSDCGADQICQAGSCADRCQTNNDCEANRVCRAGVCELLPRCNATDECASGEVCESGVCRPQTAECDGDSDCPPNFTCFEGGCYAPGTEPDAGGGGCVSCANGETCIEGECVRVDAGRDTTEDPDTSDVADAGDDPDVDAGDDADASDADAEDTDTDNDAGDADADDASDVDDVPDIDDADAIDVTPDADAADADTGCRGAADCEAGQICIGGVCSDPPTDVVEDTAPDTEPEVIECVGTGTVGLGGRCAYDEDCCSGECIGFAAEPTEGAPCVNQCVCSRLCDTWDECNPADVARELSCYDGAVDTLGGIYCVESEYLSPCRAATDCVRGLPGMVCRIPNSLGIGRCTFECSATSQCRADSACGPVDLLNGGGIDPYYLSMCTPVGGECDPELNGGDCLSGVCVWDPAAPLEPGYCTSYCDSDDALACPTGSACVSGLDGMPPLLRSSYGVCLTGS